MLAILIQLKLDLASASQYMWRYVHSNMIALETLSGLVPTFKEDQKAELLHASFKGATLFGGALARLQKLNMERANTLTMFSYLQFLFHFLFYPALHGPWVELYEGFHRQRREAGNRRKLFPLLR